MEILSDRSVVNLESIVFAFRDSFCGLTYDPCNEFNQSKGLKGDIKKKGGALHFNQRYNGQVIIWMEYPYLMFLDRPLEKKSESFTAVAQQNLDEHVIDKYLQDFLSKVTTWHRREIQTASPYPGIKRIK